MGLTSAKADPQGKRYLVEKLEKLARAGFGFIIGFDADSATNALIIEAERKLTFQLKKFDIPVLSITGAWSEDEGKGMDDYIQKKSIEEFRQLLLAAEERQWNDPIDSDKPKRPPSPRQLAKLIASEYRHLWAWHNEQKIWRIFTGRVWEAIESEAFYQVVFKLVESKGIDYDTPTYIENTTKLLRWELLVPRWEAFDRKNWIAFKNCVLEVNTGKIHQHDPSFKFTTYLDRDYQPLSLLNSSTTPLELLQSNCPHFYQWAMTAMERDEAKILKLLAIVNGVVKFRFHDLQMFVHLVGKPGTGKGTFSRLLQKLVGKTNAKSSRLDKLNKDDELARIIEAQIVVCPDEDKQVGRFAGLKSLTGGDSISYRQVYKEGGDSPFFGTLLVISNSPIFAGDTSGLDRRLCLASFQSKVPAAKRHALIEESLESELSVLTSVAITLSDAEVTRILRGLGEAEIPDFQRQSWELKVLTNSIAAWMNEQIIRDPDGLERIGEKGREGSLFNHYLQYCEASGAKAFSLQNFSKVLLEICHDVLGWEEVEKVKLRSGLFIKGLRLRSDSDGDKPWIEDLFQVCADLSASGADLGADFGADPKPLLQGQGADLADLQPTLLKAEIVFEHTQQNLQETLEDGSQVCESALSAPGKGFGAALSDDCADLEVCTPCSQPTQSAATPDDELQGWGEYHQRKPYPNPKSDNVRSSQKRALAIRQAYRAANTKEDLSALQRENGGKFSRDELTWVLNWLKKFFLAEYNHVKATAKISQPELL
jgi:putative DNA primase/helicase